MAYHFPVVESAAGVMNSSIETDWSAVGGNANLVSQPTATLPLGVLPLFEFGWLHRLDAIKGHFCRHRGQRRSATGLESTDRRDSGLILGPPRGGAIGHS